MAGVQDPYVVADECHLKPASQEGLFHLEMSATPKPSTMPRSTLVEQGILPRLQAKVPLELTTASSSSFKGDTRITAEAVFLCECILGDQVFTLIAFFSTVKERLSILKSTLGFRGVFVIDKEGTRRRQVRVILSVRTLCVGAEFPQLDAVYISSMAVRQGDLTALKVQCIGRLREGNQVYVGVPVERAGPLMEALHKDDVGFVHRITVVNTDWKRAHLPQNKARVASATQALADKTRI